MKRRFRWPSPTPTPTYKPRNPCTTPYPYLIKIQSPTGPLKISRFRRGLYGTHRNVGAFPLSDTFSLRLVWKMEKKVPIYPAYKHTVTGFFQGTFSTACIFFAPVTFQLTRRPPPLNSSPKDTQFKRRDGEKKGGWVAGVPASGNALPLASDWSKTHDFSHLSFSHKWPVPRRWHGESSPFPHSFLCFLQPLTHTFFFSFLFLHKPLTNASDFPGFIRRKRRGIRKPPIFLRQIKKTKEVRKTKEVKRSQKERLHIH